MITPSERLIAVVDKYLELSNQVQQALVQLESFYNEPNTQIVLDNVEQAAVTIEAFEKFEDSCICGNYSTYIEEMIAG